MKKVFEGLRILIKYDPNGSFSTERDKILCGGPNPDSLPEDEARQLDELGWYWSREYECWSKFV